MDSGAATRRDSFAQLCMQLAKERADLHGAGHEIAIVLDVLPEGEGETVLMVRAGRKFPARRNYWKIARGEISGYVEVEGEPLLCRFADERCRRGHAGYDGRRHEVDEHITAVGDDLRRVAARQAEIAGDGESGHHKKSRAPPSL